MPGAAGAALAACCSLREAPRVASLPRETGFEEAKDLRGSSTAIQLLTPHVVGSLCVCLQCHGCHSSWRQVQHLAERAVNAPWE